MLSQPRAQVGSEGAADSEYRSKESQLQKCVDVGLTPRTSRLPKAKTDGASFALKGLAFPLLVIT